MFTVKDYFNDKYMIQVSKKGRKKSLKYTYCIVPAMWGHQY